jgi:hypothetical protein
MSELPNKGVKAKAEDMSKAPEGWAKLSISRKFYKAEKCMDYPIKGWLIAAEQMGEESANGPFIGYIIRLTAATKCVDEGDNLIDANIGDDIILVATHAIQKLAVFANDDSRVAEMWIKPLKKIKHSDGKKSLWEYEVHVNPKPYDRKNLEAEAFKAMVSGKEGNAALPAGAPAT